MPPDDVVRALMHDAITAAKSAGASYSDVRLGRYRNSIVQKGYWLGGAFNDGKGQPGQVNAVSHGCVPSRFRNINVINTGRKA